MSDQGTGITVTFDTGYLGSIQSMSWSGITREVIEVTTFATAGGRSFELSDLYDAGEIECEILFDPSDAPKILSSAASETVTVTFSDSGTTAWAASGLMSGLTISAPEAAGRVMATATLKLSDEITITP